MKHYCYRMSKAYDRCPPVGSMLGHERAGISRRINSAQLAPRLLVHKELKRAPSLNRISTPGSRRSAMNMTETVASKSYIRLSWKDGISAIQSPAGGLRRLHDFGRIKLTKVQCNPSDPLPMT